MVPQWMASLGFVIGIIVSMATSPSPIFADPPNSPVYELRTYVCLPGKLESLKERFENHTIRYLEKHGIRCLGFWTPTDEESSDTTLICLLEHSSREAAEESWNSIRHDPEWRASAWWDRERHGQVLEYRPDSLFLTKTDYSPDVDVAPKGVVYGLRTYNAPPGKLDELNARFRKHTVELFRKHGLHSYGYWVPMDAPRSEDTLIYIIYANDQNAMDAGWAGFRADPEWKAILAETEKNGPLTSVKPTTLPMTLEPLSSKASSNQAD
jgi:NIPSNAP.